MRADGFAGRLVAALSYRDRWDQALSVSRVRRPSSFLRRLFAELAWPGAEEASVPRGFSPEDFRHSEAAFSFEEERHLREWLDRLAPSGIDVGTQRVLDTYLEQRKRERRLLLEPYRQRQMAELDEDEAQASRDLQRHRSRHERDRIRLERLTSSMGTASGRNRQGVALYFGLLVLAASASLVAFYPVIGVVLAGWTQWTLWLLTVGVTSLPLGLAHLGGRFARGLRAGENGTNRWMVWTVGVSWGIVGLGMVLVRLLIPESRDQGGTDVNPEELWVRAVVLLILYVATGAVSCTGAYMLHNPLRRAAQATARSAAARAKAETRHLQHVYAKERERRFWDLSWEQIDAFYEDLKNTARLEAAARRHDSSRTNESPQDDDNHQSATGTKRK